MVRNIRKKSFVHSKQMKFEKCNDTFTITFENRKYDLNDLEEYKIKNNEMLASKNPIQIVYDCENFVVPEMKVLMALIWYMLSKREEARRVVTNTTIRCGETAKKWFERLFVFYKPVTPIRIEVI